MSEPQHLTALAKATKLRSGRRECRQALAAVDRVAGQAVVADILRTHAYQPDSPALEFAAGVPALELIGWITRRSETWGRTMARSLGLWRVVQHHGLRVSELTVREALALADAIDPTTVTNQEAVAND